MYYTPHWRTSSTPIVPLRQFTAHAQTNNVTIIDGKLLLLLLLLLLWLRCCRAALGLGYYQPSDVSRMRHRATTTTSTKLRQCQLVAASSQVFCCRWPLLMCGYIVFTSFYTSQLYTRLPPAHTHSHELSEIYLTSYPRTPVSGRRRAERRAPIMSALSLHHIHIVVLCCGQRREKANRTYLSH